MISSELSDTLSPRPGSTLASIQGLDQMASEFVSFRDLVECGETWTENIKSDAAFDNMPVQAITWSALAQLATMVLDPIWRQFGPILLTFGFCSAQLRRAILAKPYSRISPTNDQHASCERNSHNKLVCSHSGAACDFKVIGMEDRMGEIAIWIAHNLHFDAFYYYGPDRALHISWGPKMRQMVVLMRTDAATGIRSPAGYAKGEKGRSLIARAVDHTFIEDQQTALP